LRIFDVGRKKPFFKVLCTAERVKTLAKARTIYQQVKGKIQEGERIKSITKKELMKLYLSHEKYPTIDIFGGWITSNKFRNKVYYSRRWCGAYYINNSIAKIESRSG